MLYKVTSDYAPEAEDGLTWDDPELGVDWPIDPAEVITNARDGGWPRLKDLVPF